MLDELEFDPSIDATSIGVVVDDGIVTLSGRVSHYPEKIAAERAARRIKGVYAIADEVEVRCPGATSDEEIARRALNILKWYAMVPQDAVQVTVEKSWVTLTGELVWQYQRNAAEDAVRKLFGVAGLTVEATVSAMPPDRPYAARALGRHVAVDGASA